MSLAAQDPDPVSVLHIDVFTRIDRSGFDRDPVSLPADHAHRVEVAFRGKICSEYEPPVLHFDPGDVVVPRCHTELLLERGAELRFGVGVSAAAARRECDCAQTGNSNGFR